MEIIGPSLGFTRRGGLHLRHRTTILRGRLNLEVRLYFSLVFRIAQKVKNPLQPLKR